MTFGLYPFSYSLAWPDPRPSPLAALSRPWSLVKNCVLAASCTKCSEEGRLRGPCTVIHLICSTHGPCSSTTSLSPRHPHPQPTRRFGRRALRLHRVSPSPLVLFFGLLAYTVPGGWVCASGCLASQQTRAWCKRHTRQNKRNRAKPMLTCTL
ncbi:hypothetical protein K437DRAFT_111796 [Tilletiaria anomala UBC 951]|uniref:Uncharacterized protein n=1 Tax=Tilletiaria anomala (strain ATCC 24038 / CBS 436.72 / UBC 951) TaxID=1037660 RepID=A0A066VW61_TILAU|nr:uncharacterized protein K437DRAFT_111796 [Tilletiaria anomala UBC 951]KDN45942.1 hypothetical protein K437DRAFT_111796 [Tilletiaria anomala UBC 951]